MTTRPSDSPDPWIERELAKSHPLTEEQQQGLRRVLLPTTPVRKPA